MTEQQSNQLIKLDLQATPSNAPVTAGDQLPAMRPVATQAQNTSALRFYLRCGFGVDRVDFWLHKWW